MSSDCIVNFSNLFDGLLKYLAFSSAIFALYNIHIAIKSYKKATSNYNFNNHISNYKSFCDFVSSEIRKCSMLDESKFNFFRWYNLIYPNSQSGDLEISKEYIKCINGIIKITENSNMTGRAEKRTHFSHIEHQNRMKVALDEMGIKTTVLPRSTYRYVENELIQLIEHVHEAFCSKIGFIKFPTRDYL